MDWWGNGYATEAAQTILNFAFEEKQYHKVFARYFNLNAASGKVSDAKIRIEKRRDIN